MKSAWVVPIMSLLGVPVNTQLQVCKSLSMTMPPNTLQRHQINRWLTAWAAVTRITRLRDSYSTNSLVVPILQLSRFSPASCLSMLSWLRSPSWKDPHRAHRTNCVPFQLTGQGGWNASVAVRLGADFPGNKPMQVLLESSKKGWLVDGSYGRRVLFKEELHVKYILLHVLYL